MSWDEDKEGTLRCDWCFFEFAHGDVAIPGYVFTHDHLDLSNHYHLNCLMEKER